MNNFYPLVMISLFFSFPASADDFITPLNDLSREVGRQTRDFAAASAPRDMDALGRSVSPEVRAAYERILASRSIKRKLSADEKDLILALMNNPPMNPGPFKEREALVRHFASLGVGLGKTSGEGFAGSDLWRLVNAARAASESFKIPPSILLCLTFRESAFRAHSAAWTTSAKGVAQLTNPAVADIIRQIKTKPDLKAGAENYVRLLGAKMPEKMVGAPDVDVLTKEIARLKKDDPTNTGLIEQKKEERLRAIRSHKDEPGHIFNIETNFALGAAYLAYLRYHRLPEVPEPVLGWLTAVGAYNQGLGIANEHINKVFGGPQDYNRRSLDEIFSPQGVSRLSISHERQEEMLGEVGSVRRCAVP